MVVCACILARERSLMSARIMAPSEMLIRAMIASRTHQAWAWNMLKVNH